MILIEHTLFGKFKNGKIDLAVIENYDKQLNTFRS